MDSVITCSANELGIWRQAERSNYCQGLQNPMETEGFLEPGRIPTFHPTVEPPAEVEQQRICDQR